MNELHLYWLTLKQAKPTLGTIVEQFHLAQRITAELHPHLYRELQDHRSRCLTILRKSPSLPRRKNLGSKYNILAPSKDHHIPKWHDIELTPDISFTLSTELVGSILPSKYTKHLRSLIRLQIQLMAAI